VEKVASPLPLPLQLLVAAYLLAHAREREKGSGPASDKVKRADRCTANQVVYLAIGV
jgi:hypothetical protein